MNTILEQIRAKSIDARRNSLGTQVEQAMRELRTPGEWEAAH